MVFSKKKNLDVEYSFLSGNAHTHDGMELHFCFRFSTSCLLCARNASKRSRPPAFKSSLHHTEISVVESASYATTVYLSQRTASLRTIRRMIRSRTACAAVWPDRKLATSRRKTIIGHGDALPAAPPPRPKLDVVDQGHVDLVVIDL